MGADLFRERPVMGVHRAVMAALSLMSTGTENIVFNRNFDPGTHWDNWVKYPFYPGYTSCGIVEKAGSGVATVKDGDRVAIRNGHASAHVAVEAECIQVPEQVSAEDALATVIDSTGHHQVFSDALKAACKFGRVVILGDTGIPASQHLSSDVMSKGLTIVAAHDSHEAAEWNFRHISNLFFTLVKSGRFSLAGLNTHTFRPEQCVDAYRL
ncbi:MAG: hypothetical protein PHN75_09760, partial [Syntrophales bacterium]|nr:hypothetical protein [Syntrophales bacterium]